MKIHEDPEEKDYDYVKNFAKQTGDFKTLSITDMKVIALGVQLAKENGEEEKLQKEPKPLAEFKPKKYAEDYKKIDQMEYDSSDSDEEEES